MALNSLNKLRVPFLDLKAQHDKIKSEVTRAVCAVLDSQQFILKQNVAEFEAAVAAKLGAQFAIGVASGSDALFLSLLALGIGPGDEVITTPFTFFATAGAVVRAGARPVFVDIEEASFNLDAQKISKAITAKTKAIIPVHLFGRACATGPIVELGRRHDLSVIEDAAQSFGAKDGARFTGSVGDTGCLSFFPTKNLGGAGDGGMVLTSNEHLAQRLRVLRVHGSRKKYHHDVVGINSRLDELQAAVLSVKLRFIDEWNNARRFHAQRYSEALRGLPLQVPSLGCAEEHVFHIYSILTERRDALAAFLLEHGIETAVYYPVPLHLQPCFKDLGYKKGDFPVSESVADRVLALPMYPELPQDAQNQVIESIREFFA